MLTNKPILFVILSRVLFLNKWIEHEFVVFITYYKFDFDLMDLS